MINGLSLFTGIGGLDLALNEWVRPICYCEIDRYAKAVLRSRMAEGKLQSAPIWDDVRSLDGTQFKGLVDIIYGGFPCQDISCAGLKKGLEAERSGLFFEIMRLAKEIKPSFLFLENVSNIRKYLPTIAKELAALRYDCRWGFISAYDVGAPHKRERWFCLAHSESKRKRREIGNLHKTDERSKRKMPIQPISASKTMAYPYGQRLENRRFKSIFQKTYPETSGTCNCISNGNSKRCEQESKRELNETNWWSVEPDVVRVVNGLPMRVERIKCLGNAVVPIQAKEAFKRLIGVING